MVVKEGQTTAKLCRRHEKHTKMHIVVLVLKQTIIKAMQGVINKSAIKSWILSMKFLENVFTVILGT